MALRIIPRQPIQPAPNLAIQRLLVKVLLALPVLPPRSQPQAPLAIHRDRALEAHLTRGLRLDGFSGKIGIQRRALGVVDHLIVTPDLEEALHRAHLLSLPPLQPLRLRPLPPPPPPVRRHLPLLPRPRLHPSHQVVLHDHPFILQVSRWSGRIGNRQQLPSWHPFRNPPHPAVCR